MPALPWSRASEIEGLQGDRVSRDEIEGVRGQVGGRQSRPGPRCVLPALPLLEFPRGVHAVAILTIRGEGSPAHRRAPSLCSIAATRSSRASPGSMSCAATYPQATATRSAALASLLDPAAVEKRDRRLPPSLAFPSATFSATELRARRICSPRSRSESESEVGSRKSEWGSESESAVSIIPTSRSSTALAASSASAFACASRFAHAVRFSATYPGSWMSFRLIITFHSPPRTPAKAICTPTAPSLSEFGFPCVTTDRASCIAA